MLIAALNGSPRRSGNTETLLNRALEGARSKGAETVRIDIADLDISGCRECGSCSSAKRCVVEDDMEKVYDVLARADAVIVGTPIFFSGPSGQLKIAIDRCQCLWANPIGREGRNAAIIAVGGDEKANFKNAVSEIRSFLNTVGFRSTEELLVPGVSGKGDIVSRTDAMDKAFQIGKALAH